MTRRASWLRRSGRKSLSGGGGDRRQDPGPRAAQEAAGGNGAGKDAARSDDQDSGQDRQPPLHCRQPAGGLERKEEDRTTSRGRGKWLPPAAPPTRAWRRCSREAARRAAAHIALSRRSARVLAHLGGGAGTRLSVAVEPGEQKVHPEEREDGRDKSRDGQHRRRLSPETGYQSGEHVRGIDEPGDERPGLLGVPAPPASPCRLRPDGAEDKRTGREDGVADPDGGCRRACPCRPAGPGCAWPGTRWKRRSSPRRMPRR